MAKISSLPVLPRIPAAWDGIQINFCKNPACPNFGVPADSLVPAAPGGYALDAGSSGNVPRIVCRRCQEKTPLKSNQGIAEELARINSFLLPTNGPTCPDDSCPNHGIPAGRRASYQSFGKTSSGSQRWRCKACGKVFSAGKSTVRHKKPYLNRIIFSLLMNKVPFNRICEIADIHPQTLYDKIDFIHRQCLKFVAARERRLRAMTFHRLYIGVDRQEYITNWTCREDKRNAKFTAIAAADNVSGYVFDMVLNFDPEPKAADVEAETKAETAAFGLKPRAPFRRHARLWLDEDYGKACRKATDSPLAQGNLFKDIKATYDALQARDDTEADDWPLGTNKLPVKGMQVHSEYTMHAFFRHLKDLLRGTDRLRFFLDQETGIQAACLGAFQPEISAGKCDAFFVRINKDLTVDEREQALLEAKNRLEDAGMKFPTLSLDELKVELVKEQLQQAKSIGRRRDRWIAHPLPSMFEPEKAVCWLTDTGNQTQMASLLPVATSSPSPPVKPGSRYSQDHLAHLYLMASLHGVDCFFMQVRRRLSLLERPVATASANRRVWHGYAPYDPTILAKMLDIFRVFYNYAKRRRKKVKGKHDPGTPAMRLGLARAPVKIEDIIYFGFRPEGRP